MTDRWASELIVAVAAALSLILLGLAFVGNPRLTVSLLGTIALVWALAVAIDRHRRWQL